MKLKNLLLFTLFVFSLTVNAQIIKSKLDIVGGISAREYVHGGVRYQYTDITQLGVYVGNDLEIRADENITTFSIDHMIHFGSLSFYSNRPVWYARQGYTYSRNHLGDHETRKYSYFNFAAGRELAFNDWLGVNADLGFIWQFREYREVEPPLEAPINTNFRLFPLARIQIFLSF
jgi:hypothetical protein